MKAHYILAPAMAACLVTGLVTGLAGTADAAAPARVTVTIKAEGTDLSGVVRSPKPRLCAAHRTVTVFKQKGARGGGDDQRFASDTTSLNNGVYEWSTGNTGTEGRFYAVVRAKTGCKRAASETIRAIRNP